MDRYLKMFGEIYNYLYDNDNEYTAITQSILCDLFEEKINREESFKKTVREFVKAREDVLTSDREIAAFIATYMMIEKQNQYRTMGINYYE